MVRWLNDNAGAGEVIVASLLAALTLGYVVLTARLVRRGSDNVAILTRSVEAAEASNALARESLATAQARAAQDRLSAASLHREALRSRLDGLAPIVVIKYLGDDFRPASNRPPGAPTDAQDDETVTEPEYVRAERGREYWRLTLRFECLNFGRPAAIVELQTPALGAWQLDPPGSAALPRGSRDVLLPGHSLVATYTQKQTLKYFSTVDNTATAELVIRSIAPGGVVSDLHTWSGRYQVVRVAAGHGFVISRMGRLVAGPLVFGQRRSYDHAADEAAD